MKSLLPVLAAGSTFAGASVVGLAVGVFAGERAGQPLWALVGLGIGAALGAYSAFRLLTSALR